MIGQYSKEAELSDEPYYDGAKVSRELGALESQIDPLKAAPAAAKELVGHINHLSEAKATFSKELETANSDIEALKSKYSSLSDKDYNLEDESSGGDEEEVLMRRVPASAEAKDYERKSENINSRLSSAKENLGNATEQLKKAEELLGLAGMAGTPEGVKGKLSELRAQMSRAEGMKEGGSGNIYTEARNERIASIVKEIDEVKKVLRKLEGGKVDALNEVVKCASIGEFISALEGSVIKKGSDVQKGEEIIRYALSGEYDKIKSRTVKKKAMALAQDNPDEIAAARSDIKNIA